MLLLRIQFSILIPLLMALCACGGPDGAGSSSGDPSREDPANDIYRLRNMGKLHADRDSDEGNAEAIQFLEQAVALEPESLPDNLNLAKVLVLTERFGEAKLHLDRAYAALGTAPAPPALQYVNGLYYNRVEDREAALEHLTRVTEQLPEHLQAWYQKAYAEERTKRWAEAEASYNKVLSIRPEYRAAAYRLVVVLRQLGKQDEERAMFERFNALPQEGQPDAEKCDLTRVHLRPYERGKSEPPAVELEWTDLTASFLPPELGVEAGVARVLPFSGYLDIGTDLLILGAAGAKVIRFDRSGGASRGPGQAISNALSAAPDGSAAKSNAIDGCVGDLDNDGFQDIVLLSTSGIEAYAGVEGARFRPLPDAFADRSGGFERLALWDPDHDGDLDVVAIGSSAGSLFRNNGDLTFSRISPDPLSSNGVGVQAIDAHDLDQGNDLDFVVATDDGSLVALLNRRGGSFAPTRLAPAATADGVILEDFDNDGAPDVIAYRVSGTETKVVLARNADQLGVPGQVRMQASETTHVPAGIVDIHPADIDNDGDLDLLAAATAGFILLRNTDGGTFVAEPPVELNGGEGGRTVVTADLDDDGLLDIVLTTESEKLVVLATAASPQYGHLVLHPQGGRDNKDAVGTIVDQFAGTLYQNRIIDGPSGLRVGIGSYAGNEIDGVRLRWPQGIVQPEGIARLIIDPPNQVQITQDEGLVASCPFLYADGPNGWTFLTDVVGIAPLDEWMPPGAVPHLDPEEFVRIEGDALRIEDGKIRLAITEELRETTYLDRLELFAIEHDAGKKVYLDESSKQGAYDPLTVQIFDAESLLPPVSMTLQDGTDVSAQVQSQDRSYVHGYDPAPSQWSGWVDRYALTLTTAGPASTILLTGRIGWYDSTVSYSLHQHGRTWGPLRLEQSNADRSRVTLHEDLGLPAGMDRTMITHFADESVPAGSELILSAQYRFLWDRVLFGPDPEVVIFEENSPGVVTLDDGSSLRVKPLAIETADLGYHGFSEMVGDRPKHEQTYEYEKRGPSDAFPRALGLATRYGDVLELVAEHDDRLAVLVASDGMIVEFAAPDPLADGQARTYFLRISGWAKEGSFHNATGRYIEPLPFRAMATYPPKVQPGGSSYQAYLAEYQTRNIW